MPRCFVIQGFGEKTDYTTGRTLNLDASYDVIKEAVGKAGLECIRADEIRHAGTIDQPMYEQILEADVVIADLSTYNVNAAYELGVRHALRPRTTIIVAEKEFQSPFDWSHIVIRRYEHLGKDIGRLEARRFQSELIDAITAILESQRADSPVYTFLPELRPPMIGNAPAAPPAPAPAFAAGAPGRGEPARAPGAQPPDSIKSVTDRARAAFHAGDFETARGLYQELDDAQRAAGTRQDGIVQQLALATYKSESPTPQAALEEAQRILLTLNPLTSHDTETLGLWGAVHKRLWQLTAEPRSLDEAIRGYERGFQLRQDHYNGINYAFLLDLRARLAAGPEGIADAVLAKRVRARVVEVCRAELDSLPTATPEINEDEVRQLRDQRYWLLATLQEAAFAIGDLDGAARYAATARALEPADWMLRSTAEQLEKLTRLMEQPPGGLAPEP